METIKMKGKSSVFLALRSKSLRRDEHLGEQEFNLSCLASEWREPFGGCGDGMVWEVPEPFPAPAWLHKCFRYRHSLVNFTCGVTWRSQPCSHGLLVWLGAALFSCGNFQCKKHPLSPCPGGKKQKTPKLLRVAVEAKVSGCFC